MCSLTIAGWQYLDQLNASTNMEKPPGISINISGGTIQGNIVGNVSGENAGVQYTSNAFAAAKAPAPSPALAPASKAGGIPRIFLCHANEDKRA
jgi:hypothetical protein